MLQVKMMNDTFAPEIVSDTFARMFDSLFEIDCDPEYSDISFGDQCDLVMNFAAESYAIKEPGEDGWTELSDDLTEYLECMFKAVIDTDHLIRFDAFGEFLLNEIVKRYNVYEEPDPARYAGTWRMRAELYRQCEEMIDGLPQGTLKEGKEEAVSGYLDTLHTPMRMERVVDDDILSNPFYFSEKPMIYWNTDAVPLPRFRLADSIPI